MPLYQFSEGIAQKIGTKEFSNELELHALIDKNLEEIFGLRYIKDEHITAKHGRIETLAIDEANRPVVIEYKKSRDSNQLTQANRYMTWVKQNPDSFELLIRKNIPDLEGEIDFSNPRIICFAQEFSIDDKCLALSLGAELWKYRYYENHAMTIVREEEPEQLVSSQSGGTTIKKIPRKSVPAKTVEEHLEGASDELVETFRRLDEKVMEIGADIERYTTNAEIIYKTSLNFVYLSIQKRKNRLRILFRTDDGEVDDPEKLCEKIPGDRPYGNITHQIFMPPSEKNDSEIDCVVDLLRQAYETTQ